MSKRVEYTPDTDIILKNQLIMNDLRKINDHFTEEKGRKKKANIVTYGCQMNEHDSEKLLGMLHKMGYEETDVQQEADLIIFNTCCVRENAELKVFGNLGALKSLKRKNPDLVLAVCGCMMQQPHIVEEIKQKYRHVDLVFGTHNVHNFPHLLSEVYDSSNTLVEVWDSEGVIIEGLPIDRKFDVKAFVNIMYGCNNFCSYCIVPYTRGRERSREPEVILDEIRDLVANGVKEVTLLGQNVNSYGKTLEGDVDFSELLKQVNAIEGIKRIRFMTSHPKDISKKLIDTMAECENVCEFLHLPVQAGSDTLLKRMNRNYTSENYLENIRYAKEKIPNLAISTDFIIGFPGETDEEFQDTLKLVKDVEYDSAFTFIYSMRKGTPAAEMEDQIPEDIKHERFNVLLDTLNEIIMEKNQKMKDQVVEVLVEGTSAKKEDVLMGRTRQHTTVNFKGSKDLVGELVKVRITDPKTFSLFGELVE